MAVQGDQHLEGRPASSATPPVRRRQGADPVCMADRADAVQRGTRIGGGCYGRRRRVPGITASHQYVERAGDVLVTDTGAVGDRHRQPVPRASSPTSAGRCRVGWASPRRATSTAGDVALRAGPRSARRWPGRTSPSPISAVLSSACCSRTVGSTAEAAAIERAVEAAVHAGRTTTDRRYARHGRRRRRHRRRRMPHRTLEFHAKDVPTMAKDDLFIIGGARTPMTQHVGAL